MVLKISDNWIDAKKRHKAYVVGLINKNLSGVKSGELVSFLKKYKYTISVGHPRQLEALIDKANTITGQMTPDEKNLFIKESKKIFNYNNFSKGTDKNWTAYDLTRVSKYQICPYCNQSYAFTVISKNKSFRPTLDHYFSKKDYPFLALSLNNLIPSCYTCNSSLKGQLNFKVISHLNPLHDDEEISFRLESPLWSFALLEALKSGELTDLIFAVDGSTAKAKQSIETFLLERRFVLNQKDLINFVKVMQHYDRRRINEIQKLLGGLHIKYAIQFDLPEYKNQMLGKIKKDLMSQFGTNLVSLF